VDITLADLFLLIFLVSEVTVAAANANTLDTQKTILGHPVGLFVLFFTEMWERFSYYGMRALLTLYMVKYLLLDPEKAKAVLGYPALESLIITAFGASDVQGMASQIYGLYTGFVYLSPLFGGMLADKIFGQRKTVYIGALLMALGHFLMAIESFFLLALFFIILGNGAFKPNISTQVGNLYVKGDPRRDGAFTIFYMGVNLGATFSPLICGTLGELYGWHYGFGAAGVGMLVGLVIYHFGKGLLPVDTFVAQSNAKPMNGVLKIFGSFLLSMAGFCLFLWVPMQLKLVIITLLIAGISYWIIKLPKEEKSPVLALVLLCLGTISFWIIFEQQGNTLQLWATDRTNWNVANIPVMSGLYSVVSSLNSLTEKLMSFSSVLGIGFIVYAVTRAFTWVKNELAMSMNEKNASHDSLFKQIVSSMVIGLVIILVGMCSSTTTSEDGSIIWSLTVPSTWYQSFNPFFVFTFAPLLNIFWARGIAKGKVSSSVAKMGIGCMLCGFAFIFMILASKVLGTDVTVKGSIAWLAITTWIFTMGELYLSPIGLSLVTKVAPKRILSMMMGVWFLSSFLGNFLSGYLGSFYNDAPTADNSPFFLMLTVLGIITGLFFFLAEKPLSKMTGNN
jgi:amino acid/peptide:H+ symporter